VPVESHVGRVDLFGRVMQYSSTNIVDSLAAASAVVCGECDEAQPIVVARGVPGIEFSDVDMRDKLLVCLKQ
jgi:F420-0:gamma-glutamyl ligase